MLRVIALSRTRLRLRKNVRLTRWMATEFHPVGELENYDAVIIGGGPVGLALACALGSSEVVRVNCSVALVEASDLRKIRTWSLPTDTFSNRVSSITRASQDFLQDIGAWQYVDKSRINPIEDMQVWDGISDSRIHFHSPTPFTVTPSALQPEPEPEPMAHLTENLNLQKALLHHLEQTKAVDLLDNLKVESITSGTDGDDWPILSLSDGRTLRARLLIGADGPNSPVKKYAKINSYGYAYPTHALVATLSHAPTVFQNTTAYQRFLPTGPIAFLPLSPTSSSLVWSTSPDLAKALREAGDEVVARMINAAFRLPEVSMRVLNNFILETPKVTEEQIREEISWREASHTTSPHSPLASTSAQGPELEPDSTLYPPLITSLQSGTLASFPLRLSHASSYISHSSRVALTGDAAHTLHPLAGQGLNLGLADASSLSHTIIQSLLAGGDIGSYTALAPYPKDRYVRNHAVMSVTDKLHKLYSTTWAPVVWARSMGLEVINELDSVKGGLMMSAGARRKDSEDLGGDAWRMAGNVWDGANSLLRVGKTVGGVMGNVVGGAADNVLKSLRR